MGLSCLSFCAAVLPVQAQDIEDARIRAMFVSNLMKFIDWPESAFSGPADPVQVCSLGDDPFGGRLPEALRGKTRSGRAIVIHHIDHVEEARGCQLLFLGATAWRRDRAELFSSDALGILTLGESDGFAKEGGIIGYRIQARRVSFQVNMAAASRAQLKISSKLLGVARLGTP